MDKNPSLCLCVCRFWPVFTNLLYLRLWGIGDCVLTRCWPGRKNQPLSLTVQACLDDTSVVLCVLLSSKMIRGDVDTVKLNEPSQNLEVKQKKHHLRRVPRRGPEGAFPWLRYGCGFSGINGLCVKCVCGSRLVSNFRIFDEKVVLNQESAFKTFCIRF